MKASRYLARPSLLGDVVECPRRDSNPEPTDYESAALTVELQGHKNELGDVTQSVTCSHLGTANTHDLLTE